MREGPSPLFSRKRTPTQRMRGCLNGGSSGCSLCWCASFALEKQHDKCHCHTLFLCVSNASKRGRENTIFGLSLKSGLLTGGFRNWVTGDDGTSVSARHPDVTNLFANFPTRHSAALTGSLQHVDGERLRIQLRTSCRVKTWSKYVAQQNWTKFWLKKSVF